MARRTDPAPWLMLVCAVLTLSGVTLLVPRQPVQAAPPASPVTKPAAQTEAATRPVIKIEDDGDGDELLEHWGDPKYAREERVQMAGIAGGFLLLGGLAWRKRARRPAPPVSLTAPVSLTLVDVSEQRKAA